MVKPSAKSFLGTVLYIILDVIASNLLPPHEAFKKHILFHYKVDNEEATYRLDIKISDDSFKTLKQTLLRHK